jgi:8-oxo-dGTP pyrophosphatase MutT (NUDIX family)
MAGRAAEAAETLSGLARRVNNFYFDGLGAAAYRPLYCHGCQVGMISPPVLAQLRHYPSVFVVSEDRVTFAERLATEPERSAALEAALLDMRRRDVFPQLRGWRKECYEVGRSFTEPLLFKMERSAAPLFGVRQYGVHINGFVRHSVQGLCLWLQRRSPNKQTWPNMMDNFVGGALADGVGVLETAVKEAAEEANVPPGLAAELQPAGSVSFLHLSKRGIHNNTLFIYDLELPETFMPSNNDGEVAGWELVPLDRVLATISSEEFKVTSSPVALDWLIRHGDLRVDPGPDPPPALSRLPLNELGHNSSALLSTLDHTFNLENLV